MQQKYNGWPAMRIKFGSMKGNFSRLNHVLVRETQKIKLLNSDMRNANFRKNNYVEKLREKKQLQNFSKTLTKNETKK